MHNKKIPYFIAEEPSVPTETNGTTVMTINGIRVLCFKMPVGIQLVC